MPSQELLQVSPCAYTRPVVFRTSNVALEKILFAEVDPVTYVAKTVAR